MSKRFLRLKQVMDETGQTRSSIYAGMATGDFPKAFNIGARAVAWLESEVEAWKRSKLQAAGKQLTNAA
jgi:prophage regulatory protein